MRLHRKRGNTRSCGIEEILSAINYLILPLGLFLRFQVFFYDDLPTTISSPRGNGIADTLRPVSCPNLIARNLANSTSDNGQRLFLRYTKDEPRFWLSLHTRKYDPVRWATMDYGRYYEQKLVSHSEHSMHFSPKVFCSLYSQVNIIFLKLHAVHNIFAGTKARNRRRKPVCRILRMIVPDHKNTAHRAKYHGENKPTLVS